MSSWTPRLSSVSLREKLPVLVSVLVAGPLLVAGTLACVEVRELARREASDRLDARSSELLALFEGDLERRAELQDRVARSRAVRGALLTSWVDTADVEIMLDSLRMVEDGTLPVALLGPDSATIFVMGSMPDGTDPDPTPPLRSVRSFGPVRALAGSDLFWESTPILGSTDTVLGWIVQRRRLALSSRWTVLWGDGTRVRIGQVSDSVWVDLRGFPSRIHPDSVLFGMTFERTDSSGAVLARARRIAGTPWVLLLDVPLRRVLAGSRMFLTRILTLGVFLVVGSVALIVVVSRRLTRPLVELAEAADAMHDGDYRRRVAVERQDEVGILAIAFNRMASQVEQSQVALRGRLQEARELAQRLAQAREAAEHAKGEAEEANRAKADALAAISHDIRAPLAAVMAYAEMLQELEPERHPDKLKTYARRIEECSEMQVSLASDLLDFSCIESGRLRMDISHAQVVDVVPFAVRSLEPRARKKNITLQCEGSLDAEFIGDVRRVRQVVVNLLSNAVTYTPDGERVTVRCHTERAASPPGREPSSGCWTLIEVEDTGPGIHPDDLEGIFEPFRRMCSEGGGDGSGAGLGLTIARQLTTMMKGAITVESQRGVGSRFTLWLPGSACTRPDDPVDPKVADSEALSTG